MYIKTIYLVGGGIVAAAVLAVLLLGPAVQWSLAGPADNQIQITPPTIAVSNVAAASADNNSAKIQVTFTVHNPNRSTIILEALEYGLYVDDRNIGVGHWGTILEGAVTGSGSLTTIVSGVTVPIRPEPATVMRSNLTAEQWDRIIDGTATYTISGMYAYRLTAANLQTTFDERTFELTFP